MKKWLLIFLLSLNKLFAQHLECKQFSDIAAVEKQQFIKKKLAKSLSQASNNYQVYYSRFFWKVDPAIRYIKGKVIHHFKALQNTNNIVLDLSTQLTVDSVLHQSKKINFSQQSNQTLSISFINTIAANAKDSITIFYKGEPDNTGFGSFIQSTHNNTPVIWTLSEPYGAKDWFPCRNGLDDKTDSIDIYITHPVAYKATANGMLQYENNEGINTTTFYKHRYPIATYLIAFSVTNFSVFNHSVLLDNIQLPVISYIYPEFVDSFKNNTFKVIDAMKLFHQTFSPYPFIKEKYGHTQFGWGGGMEHQTNTFLVLPDNNLMAHELAHQWFGNKITCASWQDIWLNESFATFAANYYLEKYDTTRFKNILNNHLNNIVQLPDGSVFCKDTTNPNRIFNGRLSYDKGAYVLRMLRFTIGDSLFFKTLRNYITDSSLQYGFATTNNFKNILEKTTNKNFTYFFNQWIYGEGHPTFKVTWNQNKNNWAKIKVNQTTSHPSVSFFKTMLPLTFKNATQQKNIIIECNDNNNETWVDIGFAADTVLIDVEKQLISKNNNATQTIDNNISANEINIYPVPANNYLYVTIKNPSAKELRITLFNAIGQTVYTQLIFTKGADEKIEIPVRHLPKEFYTIRIDNKEGFVLNKKILIN